MNRRQFMQSTAAAAMASTAPLPAVAAPAKALPYWTVGPFQGDSWDILHSVRAETAEEAIRIIAIDQDHINSEHMECELCMACDGSCGRDPDGPAVDTLEATREKQWDDIEGEPTSGDWARAGYGTMCSRCDWEMHGGDGRAVGNEAVCCDCMTLDDWKVVDPEYHAELLEDAAQEASKQ